MTIENEGSSTNITLLFKHGRHTILILSEPLTSFSTLKDELLSILRERYPNGLPAPIPVPLATLYPIGSNNSTKHIPIPQSIDDVVLGILTDENDPSQGWEELQQNQGKGGAARDNPTGLGLRDGSLVAFRFRKEEDEEDEEATSAEGSLFEVAWPTFDENHGETDLGQADAEMDDDVGDGGDEGDSDEDG